MNLTVENNKGKFISQIFEQVTLQLCFFIRQVKNRVTCSKICEINFPLLFSTVKYIEYASTTVKLPFKIIVFYDYIIDSGFVHDVQAVKNSY